jgi:serine phosphatase RsbU (regulator of sigma subunit)
VRSGHETEDPFGAMMQDSHLLAPHDLPDFVSRHGERVGLGDARVYLVDLQQQQLVPFGPTQGPGLAEQPALLGIDSTLAGRAFQHVELVRQEGTGDRARIWVPLLNGTERLGVLGVTVGASEDVDAGSATGERMRYFASVVAELVMSKTQYGDTIVRLRRAVAMGLAAEIQWALLPPLTFADENVIVAGALEPAYEVAGDSVDYSVDADATRFAVFDGMGHSLSSAQLVSLVVAAYRNSRRAGHTLAHTARHIDEAVTEVYGGDAFTTGLLAELDTGTGLLRWMSAGHLPPLLLRHGRLVKTLELPPELPFGVGLTPLGGTGPEPQVRVGTEQLEPGDHLLLFTDGVIEARSPEGELFGVARLTDLMIRNLAAGLTAPETMRRAVTALLEHQGGDLADDATLLLAQWRPAHPRLLLP